MMRRLWALSTMRCPIVRSAALVDTRRIRGGPRTVSGASEGSLTTTGLLHRKVTAVRAIVKSAAVENTLTKSAQYSAKIANAVRFLRLGPESVSLAKKVNFRMPRERNGKIAAEARMPTKREQRVVATVKAARRPYLKPVFAFLARLATLATTGPCPCAPLGDILMHKVLVRAKTARWGTTVQVVQTTRNATRAAFKAKSEKALASNALRASISQRRQRQRA